MSVGQSVSHGYEKVASGVFGWLVPYKDNRLAQQVPNLLSISRFSIAYLVFPLYRAITTQHRIEAALWFALITFIGFTDAWDGPLARSLGVASGALGKLIDPLSDKIFVGSLVIVWQVLLFRAHLGTIAYGMLGVALACGALEICLIVFSIVGGVKHLKLGANHSGKIKLHCQCFAILAAMIGLIGFDASRDSLLGWALAATVFLIIAGSYAIMSLAGHWRANRPTAA